MRFSRRKAIFTAAWVVALAAIGIGVAIGVPDAGLQPKSIELTGTAVLERPTAKTLITATWGSGLGQFGRDKGGMQMGPERLAVSRDNSTIAILDYVNSRVQLFGRDGTFQTAVPVPQGPALQDIAFDNVGRLVVLSLNGEPSVLLIDPKDPEKSEKHKIDPGLNPQELVVDGATVRVRGIGDTTYAVLGPDRAVEEAQQPSTAVVGTPVGDTAFQVIWKSNASASLVVENEQKKTAKEVEITSGTLPIDEIRPLGTDSSGDFYAMVRIYQEGWKGTESWYFLEVTPDGSCIGRLRLPLDFYAGGGWTVAPDGKILELRSTESGIQVQEHELGDQQ